MGGYQQGKGDRTLVKRPEAIIGSDFMPFRSRTYASASPRLSSKCRELVVTRNWAPSRILPEVLGLSPITSQGKLELAASTPQGRSVLSKITGRHAMMPEHPQDVYSLLQH